jgi:glycosyltransferase involved in cell wall biosynthesis
MRVLFAPHGEITSSVGGVELLVLRLCQRFTERGWQCGIAEIASVQRPPRVIPENGVWIWTLTAPSEPRVHRPRSWASFARATWQLTRAVNRLMPDILHVHFPAGQCLPIFGAHALPHRWRLVVTLLGSDVRAKHSAEERAWQDRIFRRADAVTAVSNSLRDEAVKQFPHLADKIRVIHNGVDCSMFDPSTAQPSTDARYFLYLGRLHPVKQVDLLLRAWALIRSRAEGVQLRLVGDGSERESLQALARELDLGSSIRWEGQRPDEELPLLYRSAEAVVLPSRREGLPLCLLEAGSSGALSIGTNVPGIADVIEDGRTGFLVDPQSPEMLGAAMLRVLGMPADERGRMQAAARERVCRHFSEERMVSGYEMLFRSLVSPQREVA